MRYKVKVKFHEDFVQVVGDEIEVGIKSAPEKGKANRELIVKLAKHFGIPSARVRIVSGAKSKNKTIEIKNIFNSSRI